MLRNLHFEQECLPIGYFRQFQLVWRWKHDLTEMSAKEIKDELVKRRGGL